MTARDGEPEPGWAPRGPEFSAWHFWVGVNGQYYARVPGSSRPARHMAGTVEDLAEMIRQTAPPCWMSSW